jgi:dTDP-glucose 4,6-dehydratase
MKLLVTGGAGFIGSNFIHYWLKEHPEDSVVNFDALTYAGNLENLADVKENPQYSFVHGDICDVQAVENVLEGIDTIVHFAAESHVDRSITDPSSFVRTNVLGTQVLLDAAVKQEIKRFHHISTDEVFGSLELESSDKFNERTLYDPRSPYAASKAGSDHLVRAYHTTYDLPVTITNCSNNFGPYHFPEKLIPLAITNVLEDKKIPIYGDGLYVRDWLYVEDHCRAIDAVLQKGKIGETYLVGGMTELYSNLEIVRKIVKLLGKDEEYIEFVKDRPGHDRKYDVDWSKIKNDLGWEPLHSFDEWLEKTVQWYKENEAWWKHIKSGEYKEYYKKQYGD